MPRPLLSALTALVLVTLIVPEAGGLPEKFRLFVEFEGLQGGSTASGHEDWSDAISFGQAGCTGVDAAMQVTGPPNFARVRILKLVDRATPGLRERVAQGVVFPRVLLDLTAESDTTMVLWQLDMRQVRVRELTSAGSGPEQRSRELVTLDFQEITWTFDDGVSPKSATVDSQLGQATFGPC